MSLLHDEPVRPARRSWPDRAIPETLVQNDPAPLLAAASTSRPGWEIAE